MIDTIRFTVDSPLRTNIPKDWRVSRVLRSTSSKNAYQCRTLKHLRSKIRICDNDFKPGYEVEASLPRLLFGSNASLIKSQDELNEAFSRLHDLLDSVLRRYEGPQEWKRVDLCWHIPTNAPQFVAIHAPVSHPDLHGKRIIYWGESVIWESSGKRRQKKAIRFQLYDKRKERTGRHPGEAIRIELQIQSPEVLSKADLFRTDPLQPLSFAKSYAYLRRFALKLTKGRVEDAGVWYGKTAEGMLADYGLRWEKMVPRVPAKAFRSIHGIEVPDQQRYW